MVSPIVHRILAGPDFEYPAERRLVRQELEDMFDALVSEGCPHSSEHFRLFHCLGRVLPFDQMSAVVNPYAFHGFVGLEL